MNNSRVLIICNLEYEFEQIVNMVADFRIEMPLFLPNEVLDEGQTAFHGKDVLRRLEDCSA